MKTYILILILAVILLITQFQSVSSPQQEEASRKPISEIVHSQPVEETQKTSIKQEKEEKVVQKEESQKKVDSVQKETKEEKKESPVSTKESQPTTQPVAEEKTSSIVTELTSTQEHYMRSLFLSLINKEREQPVSLAPVLLKSATLRAHEASQKWSHTRPNAQRWNTTLKGVIDINTVAHGENLAETQTLYKDNYTDNELQQIVTILHQGLVNSSTHYAVMTNSNYKKVNIGIYTQNKDNYLIITIAQHYIA